MQLSKFSDYSLRVLMYVGLHPEQPVTVARVAAAYDASKHHLVKVAATLREHGYLVAVRGRGGGLSLGRPAAAIGLGDVVRKTENLAIVECMADEGRCVLAGGCQLQRALGRARDAFLAVLDEYTLADLLRPRSKLLARLLA